MFRTLKRLRIPNVRTCFNKLSVSELKRIAGLNYIDLSDCFDKNEIVEKLKLGGVEIGQQQKHKYSDEQPRFTNRKTGHVYTTKRGAFFFETFGQSLLVDGALKPTNELLKDKSWVALYLVNQECAYEFTPRLNAIRASARKEDNDIEVVMICTDNDEFLHRRCVEMYPGPALPLGVNHWKTYLKNTFMVDLTKELPMLLVFETNSGKLISRDGIGLLDRHGSFAGIKRFFGSKKQRVGHTEESQAFGRQW